MEGRAGEEKRKHGPVIYKRVLKQVVICDII
jgi:hypothetical protein